MASTGEPGVVERRIESGEHERRLATGALVQQVAQIFGTLVMLAAITVLGRSLSLNEFGTYGLLVSLAAYLLLVQTSVESAAVKGIATALDPLERDRAFSTAIVLYLVAGLLAGLVIAGVGWLLVGVLGVPHRLKPDAREGVLILGVVTFVGWPLRASIDALRGEQRFVSAAAAEMIGYALFGAAIISAVETGAPLWLVIGLGGTIPALTGLAGVLLLVVRRLPFRFRPGIVNARSTREFASLSGFLLVGGATDLVVFALDRILLAAFRTTALVGLYEGPARAHNLLRQIQGTLVGTVLPAASRYLALGDRQRLRELLLRGNRYVLAATLPITITLMVFAKPLLVVWLGPKFGVAAAALTILVGYWLVNVNMSVSSPVLIASGQAGWLARFAWELALTNLVASIFLTWQYGLNGVVLGTTIPMLLLFPVYMNRVLSTLPVTLGGLVRTAWFPAYATGAVFAAAMVAVRLLVPIHTLPALIAVLVGGPLVYWGAFYSLWTNPGERALLRDLLHGAVGRAP